VLRRRAAGRLCLEDHGRSIRRPFDVLQGLLGSIQADARVWNQTKSAEERMSGLHIQRGKEQFR